MQRSSLGSGGSNDDSVLHSVVFLEGLDELGDGGTLLADSNVDTIELLLFILTVIPTLLVQDSVDGDGSLAGLTITDDQLTLATANGNHGIDGLETGLNGLPDGLTGQNAGGLQLGTTLLLGVERTLAVDGVAQSVDDTAKQLRADGNVDLFMLAD